MTVAAPHYAMIIDWSDADQAYLVTVPDLPGCRTHGESYADAACKGQDAIDGWLELHVADGRPLPAPAHTGIGEQFDKLVNGNAGDFLLVEDVRTGAIASSLCLIAQTWSYAGIPFGVGMPELVGSSLRGP